MKRSTILYFIIYCLVLVGLITLERYLLLLAIPFILYLLTGILSNPGTPDLAIDRTIDQDRISPGMITSITLSIRNDGDRIGMVFLRDMIPGGMKVVDGDHSIITTLEPGEEIELEYSVLGKRGYYLFDQVAVEVRDLLGIRSRVYNHQVTSRLFILPEAQRIRRIQIRPKNTRIYAGLIPSRQGGSGVDFFGVREYQAGDPLRWLNWRASAKHPRAYFANEFEQERVADIGIVLDSRKHAEVRSVSGESLYEHGIRAAASLTDAFMHDGNRVGMLLYGMTYLNWTFPGYGKVQRERILQALAKADPGESLVFRSFENFPTRMFPANTQLIVISPILKGDCQSFIRLRAHGYGLIVLSPNPIRFLEDYDDKTGEDREEAFRIAEVERVININRLRQSGVQVIDWDVRVPLDKVFGLAQRKFIHSNILRLM